MIPLAPPLLELARSIAPDDGALVIRNLRGILRHASPFDAGEIALQSAEGLRRFPLEAGGGSLGSPELVAHVAALGAPLRLDDLAERAPAGGHLLHAGYRSLLALPLASAGGPAGALLLVRRYPWAFVAAPLHDLATIVGMAGLCLERSLWLSALTQHGRDLHAAGSPAHAPSGSGAGVNPSPVPRGLAPEPPVAAPAPAGVSPPTSPAEAGIAPAAAMAEPSPEPAPATAPSATDLAPPPQPEPLASAAPSPARHLSRRERRRRAVTEGR